MCLKVEIPQTQTNMNRRCLCCNRDECPDQKEERYGTDDIDDAITIADDDVKARRHLRCEQLRLDQITSDDDELCVLDPEKEKPNLRPHKTRLPVERTRAGYKALAKPKKFHIEAKRGDKKGNSAKSVKNRKKQRFI